MEILVVNAGSSTIKFNVFELKNEDNIKSIARGHVSKLDTEKAMLRFMLPDREQKIEIPMFNHAQAIAKFMEMLSTVLPLEEIDCIGYRVVHGGSYTEVQDTFKTKKEIYKVAHKFTKAHADGLINTVDYFTKVYSNIPQYFDFDTLYHMQTMAPEHYCYALPQDKCKALGIRKYGEHGLSHQYIAQHSAKIFGKNQAVISCHLGSGSSISCIYNSKCVDNSMGLTPLAGVVMSTRCGNIDPSTITYMMKEYNLSPDEMDDIMNLQSGLKGICGDGDMQIVVDRMKKGDKQAKLAFDVTLNSYVKYIGGKIAQIGDKIKTNFSNLKIVFTAGIGEFSPVVRKAVIDKFSFMGIKLDKKLNNSKEKCDRKISAKDSKVEVWVLPTNEEIVVAQDIYRYLKKYKKIKNNKIKK